MNDSIDPTDPIQQLISIAEQIRAFNPVDEEGRKYVSITIGGYEKCAAVRVFYDSACEIREVSSMKDLKQKLAKWNPEQAKASRIAELKAELAKLEAA